MADGRPDYLEKNRLHWTKGYTATSVDHPVFRFYGRILKPQFGLGGNWERLVDFGCGQGAAVNYFRQLGFNARGVDISEVDIDAARTRYPHMADCFSVCAPRPADNDVYGFSDDVAVVTAIQTLLFFNNTDLDACVERLYRSMRPGGVFFATMMGEQAHEFFDNSVDAGDGLRAVNFRNERMEVRDYYMSFIKDEDQLKRKFRLFKPVHVGYYAAKLRQDEGDTFHYTFCGVK